MNDAKYIGMDVHRATISVAVRDSVGNLVMDRKLTHHPFLSLLGLCLAFLYNLRFTHSDGINSGDIGNGWSF